MRFRAGLVVGFATGFYVGTMAGRERYEQINRTVRRVKRSDTFDAATDKAKAVVDLGVERAKDIVETTFSRDAGSTSPIGPAEASPLARTPGAPGLSDKPSKSGNGDTP
jgi:hypothetical protein